MRVERTPADRLAEWWTEEARDLPWRAVRDPWAVLVSEAMSQQTQVARVVPAWHAFLEQYPDPTTAARASVGDVVTAWAGLGYNRRAVLLHRAAEQMVERHDGCVPDELDELLALPGIGPYTARAILAFAHERDVGVVDTNTGRILARLGGRALRPSEAQARADALVPEGRGWEWNQALLDLGAQVCTARRPACSQCPLSGDCAWRGRGADPAAGSAGVSRGQTPFSGSDREGRGRLVAALRRGAVDDGDLATVAGWPENRARAARVADQLVRDGLAIRTAEGLALP